MAESGTRGAEIAALGTDPGGLVLGCVQSEGEMRLLAPEWDALLASVARPSPFLSWEWVFTWWRQFYPKSKLAVVTARSTGGQLLGVAPLHLVARRAAGVRVRSLEILGYQGSAVCVDHLDFLAAPQARAAVIAGLIGEVMRQGASWDAIVLADLAEDSLLPAMLAARPGGLQVKVEAAQTCYCRRLATDAASFWQEISQRHPELARNVRRYQRRLERRYQTRFVPTAGAPEIGETLAALARLHGLSRARQGQPSNFDRADYLNFHRAMMERLAASGKLYLARLECDQRIAAVFYGMVEGQILYYYQSGFDTSMRSDGVGKLLLARVLEDAATRLRAREFDFLRGTESYKVQWADGARQTWSVYGWQAGWVGEWARWEWRTRRRLMHWRAVAAAYARLGAGTKPPVGGAGRA